MKRFWGMLLTAALVVAFAASAMAAPTKSDNFVEGLQAGSGNQITIDTVEINGIGEDGLGSTELGDMITNNSIAALGDVKICGGFSMSNGDSASHSGKTFTIPFAAANAGKLPASYKVAIAKQVLDGEKYTTFTSVVTASSASHIVKLKLFHLLGTRASKMELLGSDV